MINQLLEDLRKLRDREYQRYRHSNLIEFLYHASGINAAIDMIKTVAEQEQKNDLSIVEIDKP